MVVPTELTETRFHSCSQFFEICCTGATFPKEGQVVL